MTRTGRFFAIILLIPAVGTFAARSAAAAGRVELVVIGDVQVASDFQRWMEVLKKVGASRVQLRSRQPTDRLGIDVQGSPDAPVYVVTATITGNELLTPGGRFSRNDATTLARWIADLAENGPVERREARSAFGLSASQMSDARADLAQAVGTATAGKSRAEVVESVARRLKHPLVVDPQSVQTLREDNVKEELSGLTCGTALAYVVRTAGLGLVPRVASSKMSFSIVPVERGDEVWPVGWKPEKPLKDTLPILYEFLNVNIQGIPVAKAIDAIAQRIKAPLLWDYNALARHGIDSEKVTATLPPGRSTYSLILQKVLFQARLKMELRVDEAGTPFLWLTSIKPL